MKKFLLWGLAIILALGIIGGMMDSETPQADPKPSLPFRIQDRQR